MKNTIKTERRMNHKFSVRKPRAVEVQTWGLDSSKQLVCAGVHYMPSITARALYKLATSWRRWRRWYDNLPENKRRDYPAKHDCALAYYGAHPIDNPQAVKWLAVTA